MFVVKSDTDGTVHWDGAGEDTALFVAIRRTILREVTHTVYGDTGDDSAWVVTFDGDRRVIVEEVRDEDD